MRFTMNTDQSSWEICNVIAQANEQTAAYEEEKYRRSKKAFGIAFGTVGVALGLTGAGMSVVRTDLLLLAMAVLLSVIGMFLLVTVCTDKTGKETIKTASDMLNESGFLCDAVEFEITDERLNISSDGICRSYAWSALTEWDEYKNFVYIITRNDRIIILDRRQMDPDCLSMFMRLLKSNVKHRYISTTEQKGKHIADKQDRVVRQHVESRDRLS